MSAGNQIDYNALAQQSGAISSQPAPTPTTPAPSSPSPSGAIDYNALAKASGAISSQPAPTAAPAPPVDTLSGPDQLASWPKQQQAPVIPPQDHKEELVRSLSGDVGLGVYRQARDTVGKVENLIKSPSEAYAAAKQEIQNLGANAKANLTPEPYDLDPAHHPQGIYAQPIPPVTLPGVSVPRALEAAAAEPAEAAVSKVGAFRRALQSPEERGAFVTQPAAQQAIRQGVQTATENAGTDAGLAAKLKTQPLLSRGQTIVDEHMSSLRGLEQDAYDKMDEEAGFDVKAEKAQLSNDQYKLKQLGNTEPDIAQKEKLTASIKDSQTRIADAESKMKEAGIDPTEADALHKQRMAGSDFKKALIQNTSSDGQTVNVNNLLNATKKLQFTKYGNRLQQFFGSPEAANNFLSGLEQAQKAGQTAMDSRALRNMLLKYVGGGTAVLIGGDIAKHYLP